MLGEAADGAALAGRVAALEDDRDALAVLLDPALHLHELDLQRLELLLVAQGGLDRADVDVPGAQEPNELPRRQHARDLLGRQGGRHDELELGLVLRRDDPYSPSGCLACHVRSDRPRRRDLERGGARHRGATATRTARNGRVFVVARPSAPASTGRLDAPRDIAPSDTVTSRLRDGAWHLTLC